MNLSGTAGNDTLSGGTGDDTLDGGSGDDALNGGLGNDLYRYTLGSGNDVITDTGGVDTLELADPFFSLAAGMPTAAATIWSSISLGRGRSPSRISFSRRRSSTLWLSRVTPGRSRSPIL